MCRQPRRTLQRAGRVLRTSLSQRTDFARKKVKPLLLLSVSSPHCPGRLCRLCWLVVSLPLSRSRPWTCSVGQPGSWGVSGSTRQGGVPRTGCISHPAAGFAATLSMLPPPTFPHHPSRFPRSPVSSRPQGRRLSRLLPCVSPGSIASVRGVILPSAQAHSVNPGRAAWVSAPLEGGTLRVGGWPTTFFPRQARGEVRRGCDLGAWVPTASGLHPLQGPRRAHVPLGTVEMPHGDTLSEQRAPGPRGPLASFTCLEPRFPASPFSTPSVASSSRGLLLSCRSLGGAVLAGFAFPASGGCHVRVSSVRVAPGLRGRGHHPGAPGNQCPSPCF